MEVSAQAFEMLGGDLLHFNLIIALSRVNVIELFFAAQSRIRRNAGVKRFGNSENFRIERKFQTQVIESPEFEPVINRSVFFKRLVSSVFRDQQDRAEIESIANAARLVVNQWVVCSRIARFVSDAPILTFFSIQSARYAQAHRQVNGVDLGIFYHPTHDWNVKRMLDALQAALVYYQANFGPYQFDQARIIEFPAYSTFAQAFANTMPYSESIGFVADTSDPDKIDYVTYVTAHELGHQYWAHQVIGADMQGATMLSETLAQYSALMVMKSLYAAAAARRSRNCRSRGSRTSNISITTRARW